MGRSPLYAGREQVGRPATWLTTGWQPTTLVPWAGSCGMAAASTGGLTWDIDLDALRSGEDQTWRLEGYTWDPVGLVAVKRIGEKRLGRW